MLFYMFTFGNFFEGNSLVPFLLRCPVVLRCGLASYWHCANYLPDLCNLMASSAYFSMHCWKYLKFHLIQCLPWATTSRPVHHYTIQDVDFAFLSVLMENHNNEHTRLLKVNLSLDFWQLLLQRKTNLFPTICLQVGANGHSWHVINKLKSCGCLFSTQKINVVFVKELLVTVFNPGT